MAEGGLGDVSLVEEKTCVNFHGAGRVLVAGDLAGNR